MTGGIDNVYKKFGVVLVTNAEGERDYEEMVVEGEWDTKRRVEAIRNGQTGSDGGKTDEDMGGYFEVFARLRVEKM